MAAAILLLLLSIILIVAVYFRWSFGYWNRRGVKVLPARFPFGNATNVFLQKVSLGELLKDIYMQWKPKGWKLCGFYFLTKPSLLIFDLDLAKSILAKDFPHFTGHGIYVNEEDDPLSAHLFSFKNQQWRHCRNKLTPSFSPGKVKMMFDTILDCSEDLVMVIDKAARDRETLDINDIAMRYTLDVITSCAFGIESKSLSNPKSEFINYAKQIVGDSSATQHFKILLSMILPSLMRIFHIPFTSPEVGKFFMNIVRETIKYREENNVIRKDFMHLLIQMKNNVTIEDEESVGQLTNKTTSGESLTIEQITAQVWLFYVGGYKTSATTIAFCLFELATNFKIQETLRTKIVEVLAKHNGKITYDALTEMTYMDKCIYETLRKYPPLPSLYRECTKTYKVPDSEITLDEGTSVIIPILGIHYDPEFYPNPEQFDPERFSPENKSKRPQYAWLPFGEGPRMCLGIKLGLTQIKIALTVLLRNYRFTLNPKTPVPLVLKPGSILMIPKEAVCLNAEQI